MWGLFDTAACRPIVPLSPMSSPHSSPEAPRTTLGRETSASEGANYTRNFASTFVIHGGTRFFDMPQSWDMGQILSLPLRRMACGGFFRCLKKSNDFGRVWTRELGYRSRPLIINVDTMCQYHGPGALTSARIAREAVWAPGPVWKFWRRDVLTLPEIKPRTVLSYRLRRQHVTTPSHAAGWTPSEIAQPPHQPVFCSHNGVYGIP